MRANVADKRCENGHFIDESWDLCPYCPADESAESEIPVVRPSRFTSPQTEPRPATQAGPRPGTQGGDARRPVPVPVPQPAPRRDAPVQAPPMERTVAAPK